MFFYFQNDFHDLMIFERAPSSPNRLFLSLKTPRDLKTMRKSLEQFQNALFVWI